MKKPLRTTMETRVVFKLKKEKGIWSEKEHGSREWLEMQMRDATRVEKREPLLELLNAQIDETR